jgi:ArsR family transcriptional regulator
MMDTKQFSRYFKAFSDQSRLTILQLLSGGEMTVGEITAKLGLAQPTVSRHLAILRAADVVHDRREGQQVIYSLNRKAVSICCTGFCDCLKVEPVLRGKSRPKK